MVGWVENPDHYPVSAKRHSMEHLRTVAHLRPRTNTFGAVARVRDCLSMAVHRYFHEHGFFWVHTPIITTSDAEGAGAMFRVSTLDLANPPRDEHGEVDFSADFFGKPASLTVSGQLNVEAYCLALSRVYTFGPTFRAENSNTTRHLAEFWMIEPEIAFADLADDADLAEDFLKYLFRAVLDERADDMAFFAQHIDKDCITPARDRSSPPASSGWTTATPSRRSKRPSAKGVKFEFPVKWGVDLQSEHERYLTETLVGRPVVVMNYPKQIKAFYMRLNDDGRTVAAMDVLAPGIGEIIGGSQREERLDVLDARLDEIGPLEGAIRLVPRPPPLRHRPPRRLRPRLRADDRLRHRHGQHPRRDPVPAHAGQRRVLIASTVPVREPTTFEDRPHEHRQPADRGRRGAPRAPRLPVRGPDLHLRRARPADRPLRRRPGRSRDRAGEVVAIWLDSSPELVIAYLGALKAGVVPNVVNGMLKPDEVRAVVADSGARLLVTDPDRWADARAGAGRPRASRRTSWSRATPTADDGARSFDAALAAGSRPIRDRSTCRRRPWPACSIPRARPAGPRG